MSDIIRAHPQGTVVAVRAQPGASRAELVGPHGDALKVKVCSPPVDGRANDELIEVLAIALGVRPRDVTVVGGHTARSKQVLVQMPVDEVRARLAPWIGPVGTQQR